MNIDKIIEQLNWRYAVKKFDKHKKIDETTFSKILEAANLTATSFGLQPYKIIAIKDKEVLKSLATATFRQAQIQTCSHLLIICSEQNVDENYVNKFVENTKKERELPNEISEVIKNTILNFMEAKGEERKSNWIDHQAYIVLGNLLTVCAMIGIDTCPMEGFNAKVLDETLELKKMGLASVLLLPIGYRAEDDTMQHAKKVRNPLEKMVIVK